MVCVQNLVLSPARGTQVVRESTIRWMSQECKGPWMEPSPFAEEMVLLTTCLPHKHSDMSLIPRTHMKTKT